LINLSEIGNLRVCDHVISTLIYGEQNLSGTKVPVTPYNITMVFYSLHSYNMHP